MLIDIGAGNTKGIYRISQDPSLGKDLDCMATGLTLNAGRARYLGLDRFRRTPVEVMEGFEDNSIAGMLAVDSLAYSASPEIAASRIDDLLVPGGAIKANFRGVEEDMDKPFGVMARHDEFTAKFRRLRYDVGIVNNGEVDVILAIKPGNVIGVTAQELIERDKKENDDYWAHIYKMHAGLPKLVPKTN